MTERLAGAPRGRVAARRRAAFAAARRLARIDALLVTRPSDVRYLSGFTGEDSFLLVHRRGSVLLTDGRFDEQARAQPDHINDLFCPLKAVALVQLGQDLE